MSVAPDATIPTPDHEMLRAQDGTGERGLPGPERSMSSAATSSSQVPWSVPRAARVRGVEAERLGLDYSAPSPVSTRTS